MHSTDMQLRKLLSEDESSQELLPIARHVEGCEHCQARLGLLTGVGDWTAELVNTLRGDASATLEVDNAVDASSTAPPLTVVLDQVADIEGDEIELDPMPLDFLSEPVHPELLGRLGRYDIERVIGAGGMGLVLKGFDAELHRPVAIKVLAPHLAHSAAARKRFAREAQATAAVIHPHVIPIHNVETTGKLPYLVMSYIDGWSLQWYVDTHGPLGITETLRIAMQTAAGMRAAHEQNLIHRDVKPANILLEKGTLRVVLSDFGLARTMDDASLTRTGIVTGTPHYMSPEQAGGDAIDSRSDLFSLGCVMYFMLTGRPPFRAATAMGVLNRICNESHRPVREVNPMVPVPLAKIIDRLLAKRAADRYASAEELEQSLQQVMHALHDGRLKLSSVRMRARHIMEPILQRTRRWRVALAASALFACIAFAWILWIPLSQPLRPNSSIGQDFASNVGTAWPTTNAAPITNKSDAWEEALRALERDVLALERGGVGQSSVRSLIDLSGRQNRDLQQLETELKSMEMELSATDQLLNQKIGEKE